MKLVIKNNNIFRGTSTITDETGREVFKMKGRLKWFSPTKKKYLLDLNGNTIYTIRNIWGTVMFHGAIIKDNDGNKLKMKSKLSIKSAWTVKNENDEYAIGRSKEHSGWDLRRNEEVIANIRRQGLGIVIDTYLVDVYDETYADLIVAFVIALDNIRDKNRED